MEWYYKLDDVRGGPLDHEAICRMVADGLLPLEARVWREGFPRFLPASILPGFKEIRAKAEGVQAPAEPAPAGAALTALMTDPWSPPADVDLDVVAPLEQAAEPIDQSEVIGVRAYFAGGQMMTDRSPNDITQARPWVRFWARTLDGLLYCILIFLFVLPATRSHAPIGWWFPFAVGAGMLCLQAAMLSLFGTTPGKLLLGTSVRTLQGEKLSFGEAFSRECAVLARGQGLGLGLISVLFLLFAYRRLERDGATTWDEFGGFVVRHERIGLGRAMLALMGCAIGLLVATPPLMAASREATKMIQEQSKSGVTAGNSTGSSTGSSAGSSAGGRDGSVTPYTPKPRPVRKAPPKKIIM